MKNYLKNVKNSYKYFKFDRDDFENLISFLKKRGLRKVTAVAVKKAENKASLLLTVIVNKGKKQAILNSRSIGLIWNNIKEKIS